ncbi:A circularly permuted ATPgrasp family protein [Limnohabitans sp. 2KL-1]|uniref:circularly permuted type 2 ATP-grasp protein n=1 Tax=Limnohabitans sp. 2KL-1 TaxID=1100699 RepID=UPI000D3BE2C6|nr:circularly permuted type 2 ATP-grasp protein [Limnohabitans sp. 2KL-1]PUE47163.1 A circularly permuted ATPgrasp family protein [Limnohabitans sp. 2KL-1]
MNEPSPAIDKLQPVHAMKWLALQQERAPAGHWDELRGQVTPSPGAQPQSEPSDASPTISGPWQAFIEPLDMPGGLSDLNTRMNNLQRQVRDNGITYNVYAASDQPQRPWSLDLFPLMLGHADWQQIEAGVMQRMQLLERIMADAYGPQQLVLSGQLPAALVQGHPAYLPAMHGVPPVGGRYLSLAAFDLARGPDGCWWLLSQRTQAPSGLGYLLENRQIVSRQFPQAFEAFPVQRLAETYRTLIDGIKARSPAGASAHIALLTPGPYNETYFEHAYLARYLGLSLVQGNDLTVRDEKLYLKTLQGLQPVHGLLKRVDDDWLDPLEMRADSTLGVPGLLQAVRSGNVLVANTPGSGFLESNALLGFMPALARDLLGQELQLPAIPSWWCGEAAALQDVLPRIQSCVIKPTYPYNTDRQSFEPVLGHALSRQEQNEWAGRILRDPDAHTLQSWLPLSHQPTWHTGADGSPCIQSRPLVLRVFAVANAQGHWQVLPGGLARLGTREGIASMQRGGSSADVWVQSPTATEKQPHSQSQSQGTTAPANTSQSQSQSQSQSTQAGQSPEALSPPLTPALAAPSTDSASPHRQRLVTSRAAENLFWMGRYTERTENTLRLVRLSLEILGSENQNLPCLRQFITRMATRHGLVRAGVPAATQAHRVFERSLIAGLWDKELATSVGFNLRAVRLAAASVRERLSPEHWRLLEQAESRFFSPDAQGSTPDTVAVQRLLADTSQMLAALTGAQTDRMSRDDGWRLLSIGRHIERLQFLSNALSEAVQLGLIGEQAGFDAVLDLFDSTISFHAQYQQSRTPQALMDLLVTNADNPRSLGWVAHTLRSRLRRMGQLADGATLPLADLVPQLIELSPEALWPLACSAALPGSTLPLHSALAHGQKAAHDVSDQLCGLFFTHSGEARYSVGA